MREEKERKQEKMGKWTLFIQTSGSGDQVHVIRSWAGAPRPMSVMSGSENACVPECLYAPGVDIYIHNSTGHRCVYHQCRCSDDAFYF